MYFKFTKCCCGCIYVDSGSILIAIVDLVVSILGIVVGFFYLVEIANDPEKYKGYYKSVQFLYIFVFTISLIVSSLLYKGYCDGNHRLIKPYLIFNCVALILSVFGMVIAVIVIGVSHQVGADYILIALLAGLILILLRGYLIHVVYRFKKELLADAGHKNAIQHLSYN